MNHKQRSSPKFGLTYFALMEKDMAQCQNVEQDKDWKTVSNVSEKMFLSLLFLFEKTHPLPVSEFFKQIGMQL
mgnify:CR=1 FL=1